MTRVERESLIEQDVRVFKLNFMSVSTTSLLLFDIEIATAISTRVPNPLGRHPNNNIQLMAFIVTLFFPDLHVISSPGPDEVCLEVRPLTLCLPNAFAIFLSSIILCFVIFHSIMYQFINSCSKC